MNSTNTWPKRGNSVSLSVLDEISFMSRVRWYVVVEVCLDPEADSVA